MISSKLAVILIVFGSFLGASAQLLFKTGLNPLNLIKVGSGFMLYGVSFLIYLFALRSLPLSVAYPFVAVSYPLVAIGSFFFLDEPFTAMKWAGTGGLIFCLWLIAK